MDQYDNCVWREWKGYIAMKYDYLIVSVGFYSIYQMVMVRETEEMYWQ